MNDEELALMHPPAPTLEAIAAGDEAGVVASHLAACEACARYVASLRSEVAAFRSKSDPRAFAERVRARARVSGARGWRVRSAWLLAPALAAAAALAVWLPSRAPELRVTIEPVGQAEHFKGGVAVAVIRDRGGLQERLAGPFEVAASDRIRLEVAVDHEGPVTAGLLSEDGAWTPLLAPVSLAAGTHYSELAARFDDAPTDAILLAGPPADVDRARATRNFEGVVAWRVRSAAKR